MKKILFILTLVVLASSCTSTTNMNNNLHNKPNNEKNNEEWELTVFDSEFDNFLLTYAKPKSFYSMSFLKTKNTFLTAQWNQLYYSGRYRNIIESNIDYDPKENYGLDYEYKLYQVFVYVKWKYGLRLDGLTEM